MVAVLGTSIEGLWKGRVHFGPCQESLPPPCRVVIITIAVKPFLPSYGKNWSLSCTASSPLSSCACHDVHVIKWCIVVCWLGAGWGAGGPCDYIPGQVQTTMRVTRPWTAFERQGATIVCIYAIRDRHESLSPSLAAELQSKGGP